METKELYKIFKESSKITTDSRNIIKNSIFFALKGTNFNGNKYASDAIEQGCSYAVIDENKYVQNNRYILVDNVLESLQQLAHYHRQNLKIPIIAITGTNGKTTTKELIKAILSKKYNIIGTEGNLNNHIGVPLTLLSMNNSTEIGIVEMGANHMGEIKELCEIAEPDYGLITNIGKAHLEGFGSFEGVIKAKSELYEYLSKNNKTIFVNIDNNILNNISVKSNKITYGTNTLSVYQGEFIEANPFVKLNWKYKDTNLQNYRSNYVETQLIGKYNFENILASICIGKFYNVSDNDIKHAIEQYKPTNNRSQLIKSKFNTLLLDFYNANPTSMKEALSNFADIKSENKIIILGDMFELGDESEKEHLKIINILKRNNFKDFFLIGNTFNKVSKNTKFKSFESTNDFINWVKNNRISDSYILIKGSRGMHLENIIEFL